MSNSSATVGTGTGGGHDTNAENINPNAHSSNHNNHHTHTDSRCTSANMEHTTTHQSNPNHPSTEDVEMLCLEPLPQLFSPQSKINCHTPAPKRHSSVMSGSAMKDTWWSSLTLSPFDKSAAYHPVAHSVEASPRTPGFMHKLKSPALMSPGDTHPTHTETAKPHSTRNLSAFDLPNANSFMLPPPPPAHSSNSSSHLHSHSAHPATTNANTPRHAPLPDLTKLDIKASAQPTHKSILAVAATHIPAPHAATLSNANTPSVPAAVDKGTRASSKRRIGQRLDFNDGSAVKHGNKISLKAEAANPNAVNTPMSSLKQSSNSNMTNAQSTSAPASQPASSPLSPSFPVAHSKSLLLPHTQPSPLFSPSSLHPHSHSQSQSHGVSTSTLSRPSHSINPFSSPISHSFSIVSRSQNQSPLFTQSPMTSVLALSHTPSLSTSLSFTGTPYKARAPLHHLRSPLPTSSDMDRMSLHLHTPGPPPMLPPHSPRSSRSSSPSSHSLASPPHPAFRAGKSRLHIAHSRTNSPTPHEPTSQTLAGLASPITVPALLAPMTPDFSRTQTSDSAFSPIAAPSANGSSTTVGHLEVADAMQLDTEDAEHSHDSLPSHRHSHSAAASLDGHSSGEEEEDDMAASTPMPATTVPVRSDKPSRSSSAKHAAGGHKKCNCKKSKCLKLYCECFAAQVFCNGCNCSCCHNTPKHKEQRDHAIKVTLERDAHAFFRSSADAIITDGKAKKHRKGCHCKKSGCLKKYCECYQAGVSCSEQCKCLDCKNGRDCGAHDDSAKKGRSMSTVSKSRSTATPSPLTALPTVKSSPPSAHTNTPATAASLLDSVPTTGLAASGMVPTLLFSPGPSSRDSSPIPPRSLSSPSSSAVLVPPVSPDSSQLLCPPSSSNLTDSVTTSASGGAAILLSPRVDNSHSLTMHTSALKQKISVRLAQKQKMRAAGLLSNSYEDSVTDDNGPPLKKHKQDVTEPQGDMIMDDDEQEHEDTTAHSGLLLTQNMDSRTDVLSVV